MPLESHGDPRRLLPPAMEDRLIGWLSRAAGALLLAAVGAAWASLLTWSQSDPSITHAAGGTPTNVLGSIGAILADVMLNTLGFAAVFLLLAPMFWGIELLIAERVFTSRRKTSMFPIAVLLLAGGFAVLPVASTWPFGHSFGGIVGDWLYSLTATLFGLVGAQTLLPLAGLAYFAAGFAALGYSVGLERDDLNRFIERSRGIARRRNALMPGWLEPRGWFSGLSATRVRWHDEPMTEPRFAAETTQAAPLGGRREPTFEGARAFAGVAAERAAPSPSLGQSLARPLSVPARHPSGVHAGPHWHREASHSDADADDFLSDHDVDFDASTDAESRAIAERFAPRASASGLRIRLMHRSNTQRPIQAPVEPAASAPPVDAAQAPVAPVVVRKQPRFAGFGRARSVTPAYRPPALSLLRRPAASKPAPELAQTVLRGTARLLEEVLADFSIKGEVREIKPGPVVTLFELEPARGTKSSRIVALAEDIARSMSVTSARAAIVPGRNVIGIELPNVRRETVYLREILEAEAFRAADAALPLALGKSINGDPIVADLARMPHMLVAGTTGSGKSVGVNAMVLSLLYRRSPEECRLLMIDPKMLELSVYNGIPHLLTPVVTDPQKAVAALNWVVAEMEERYKRMASLAVRNIEAFNARVRQAQSRGEILARTVHTGFDAETGQPLYETQEMQSETMPYIVVVVDEFADLMIVAGKEIEAAVQRLAQMARAAGIHLIMATQRPSVDIVTGTIKANFPARISFKVASKIDSRTILNEQGAEALLGQGDMLYSMGSGQTLRAHGPFVSDEEVERIAEVLRRLGQPRYVEGVTDVPTSEAPRGAEEVDGSGDDDLYDKAVAIVMRDRKASTSYLQRRLAIGYNRAADLIERMERDGLVGPANNVGKREILVTGRDPGAAA